MIIVAKYPSKCPACGKSIIEGSKVEWIKGERAKQACQMRCHACRARVYNPGSYDGYQESCGISCDKEIIQRVTSAADLLKK